MYALVLDENLETLCVLDTFESFIWTDRYCGYGEFELYMPIQAVSMNNIVLGNYIKNKNSNHLMIIEEIMIDTNVEDGTYVTITGRSLESILRRRVIWGQKILSDSLQDGICELLDENAVNPENTNRQISKLSLTKSTDYAITSLTVDAQFFGDNLYDVIVSLCDSNSIGFQILPTTSGKFNFKLYSGVDRSYNQESNNWVVFSPTFGNLLSSNYYASSKEHRNLALVAGEGSGSERTLVTSFNDNEPAGLNRKEVYVDVAYISQYTSDGELTTEEYEAQLEEAGYLELSSSMTTESFEGEVEDNIQFIYGKDFFVGDTVQIINEYGYKSSVRVSEIIQSHDVTGEKTIPTFMTISEGED